MNQKAKTAVLAASLALNALCAAFFALALTRKTESLFFLDLDDKDNLYVSGAFLVSLPPGGELEFGPASLTLTRGEKAAVQFSSVRDGKQLNMAVQPLYDRAVVRVEQSGYGFILTGLSPGETVLQALGEGGIRDVVRVTVRDYEAVGSAGGAGRAIARDKEL